VSNLWLISRLIGMILAIMVYFKLGPSWIYSEDTGGLILYDLIQGLFAIFLFAGFLLPFLTDFGLLEFVGALLTPIMRPIFGLPGRASIDCIASWVGDGTIGVALTNKQYEEGYYTNKEASIIATTFSAVSITFCLVVLGQVDLAHLFGPYYLTVAVAGIVAAIIVPKIPPLSRKSNDYYKGIKKDKGENAPEGYTNISWGLELALKKADESFKPREFIANGTKSVLDLWLGVLPIIMAFGTIALIIAEFTPVFQWLGMPFIPILKLLRVPYAVEASQTIMVGFADMFLPSVIGASIPSEMTRFIIASLSVTQLIYLSEAGAVMLGAKMDISLKDLFIIFIERTLITLPIIVLAANIIF
ncbi:MAG TPA: YjiH family protein, partial [Tissierellaceae bacterium]|nr:YjiH family protein [Tissierellaceae bacterium]